MNVEKRKQVFSVAYIVYLAELILFSSMYGKMEQFQTIFAVVRVTAYFLICTKLALDFFEGDFSWKEIGAIGVVTLLLIGVALTTGNKAMLIYWAFIVAAHDVEFERIIKMSLIVHLVCLVFVVGSSYVGIIENRVYGKNDAVIRLRDSLGFQYATESSNYFFYMLLMWIYCRKEKITWIEIMGLFVGNVFLFEKTDTKSAFALGVFILTGAALLKCISWLRIYRKWYVAISAGIVPILSFIIICFSVKYDETVLWMYRLNKILSSRLKWGRMAFEKYGIHLWGQRIEWVGGTASFEGVEKAYNYVDSSYMQILINFGVIVFVLLLVLFIVLGIKIAVNHDLYFLFVLFFIAVHSTFDPQIIWMEFDPFVMIYSYFTRKALQPCNIERKRLE